MQGVARNPGELNRVDVFGLLVVRGQLLRREHTNRSLVHCSLIQCARVAFTKGHLAAHVDPCEVQVGTRANIHHSRGHAARWRGVGIDGQHVVVACPAQQWSAMPDDGERRVVWRPCRC